MPDPADITTKQHRRSGTSRDATKLTVPIATAIGGALLAISGAIAWNDAKHTGQQALARTEKIEVRFDDLEADVRAVQLDAASSTTKQGAILETLRDMKASMLRLESKMDTRQ